MSSPNPHETTFFGGVYPKRVIASLSLSLGLNKKKCGGFLIRLAARNYVSAAARRFAHRRRALAIRIALANSFPSSSSVTLPVPWSVYLVCHGVWA